ncbi:MAG TPA: hypothetical protein VGQ05_07685 [Streptosporangiaceae bacterium]|jgi:hypothetical protein|nr:hypothetical protein [Streptosporangiaceae bacterium]
MTGDYRVWRGSARVMAETVDAVVTAARAGDPVAFGEAMTGLAALDREQLAVLLGTVMRELLERSHPDGLDSDDAQHVLSSTARRAVAWYEPLDGAALLEALIGALGVTDPDGAPQPEPDAVLAHGVLLIADQLHVLGQQLPPVLKYALGELQRAQTMELP